MTIVRIISNGLSGAGDTLTVACSWDVLVLLLLAGYASQPAVLLSRPSSGPGAAA
jgi:hypothetical protein